MSWNNYGRFPKYVTVAERKEKIAQKTAKLKKKSSNLEPIIVQGRRMVKTFWGESWCNNLESYADYEYRLERGRTYVRHGAVVDLKIQPGEIYAKVCGTRMYTIHITIAALGEKEWRNLIKECSGKINSLIELLQGQFSQHIMQVITQPNKGLFPKPHEISFDCSCPDHASMCKHVGAVLYGIGIRLDDSPEQLFILRQVDHTELLLSVTNDSQLDLSSSMEVKTSDDELGQLFGIDIAPTAKETSKETKAYDATLLPKKPKTGPKRKKSS